MRDLFLKVCVATKSLADCNDGQGMTEYAMAASLVAFGCIAGESAIATSVNQVFVTMGTIISNGVLH